MINRILDQRRSTVNWNASTGSSSSTGMFVIRAGSLGRCKQMRRSRRCCVDTASDWPSRGTLWPILVHPRSR